MYTTLSNTKTWIWINTSIAFIVDLEYYLCSRHGLSLFFVFMQNIILEACINIPGNLSKIGLILKDIQLMRLALGSSNLKYHNMIHRHEKHIQLIWIALGRINKGLFRSKLGVSNLKLIDCYELNVIAAIYATIAMNIWEIKNFK
ncbi:hypothetical protein ACJX0J_020905 [Zea mays]